MIQVNTDFGPVMADKGLYIAMNFKGSTTGTDKINHEAFIQVKGKDVLITYATIGEAKCELKKSIMKCICLHKDKSSCKILATTPLGFYGSGMTQMF